MNVILALLISKEFCVETVIVRHTSFPASLPNFSVFSKCITVESTSLHLLTLCVITCAPLLPFILCSPSYLQGKTLIYKGWRRDSKHVAFGTVYVKQWETVVSPRLSNVWCHCCVTSQIFILESNATVGFWWLSKTLRYCIHVFLADSFNGATRL